MITPHYFAIIILRYMPETQAALVNGMLLGLPVKTDPYLYYQLRITGLVHLIVLSGTNITFLEAWFTSFTRIFGRVLSKLLTIFLLGFFVFIVGFQAPIMRALFMNILTSVAILFGRRNIPLYSLFLSFLVIVIIWPEWSGSLSLQLSYGATLGLILWGPRVHHEPDEDGSISHNVFKYIRDEIHTSIAAQIFITPLLVSHFHQLSLISPLANAAVAWTVPYIMVLGFMIILFHYIFPPISYCLGALCTILVHIFFFIVNALSHFPYASIYMKI